MSFSLFNMVYLHFTSVHFRLFSLLQLINETRIVIVPSINPDGLEVAVEKQCTSLQGMTNAHGKDLDTDFFGQSWLRLIFSKTTIGAKFTCLFCPFRQRISAGSGDATREQSNNGLNSGEGLHPLCGSGWRLPGCYLPLQQACPVR